MDTTQHENQDLENKAPQKHPIVERPSFTPRVVEPCHEEIMLKLINRLKQKGDGIYLSSHETLGIVTEEYHELVQAVQDNDTDAQYAELLDIAVACLAGMASIKTGEMHW